MSSNVSMILSMIMVAAFMILGGDMVCMSSTYSVLDNTSNTIGYLISKNRRTDSEYLSYLEETYNVNFSFVSNESPTYGEVVEFRLYKNYHPYILSSHDIRLTIRKFTVIGYYG